MNMWWKSSIALIAIAASVVSWAEGWNVDTQLEELASYGLSDAAPDLEGKVTLIDFWASWCAPCKAAFPEMDKLQTEYGSKGFQIIAISVDQNEGHMRRFLDKQKPGFATPHDANQSVVSKAGIKVMPSSFMVDKNGVIRFAHEGWQGKKSVQKLKEEIETLLAE